MAAGGRAAYLGLAGGTAGFALVAAWVSSGSAAAFDSAVRGFVHAQSSDPLTAVMQILTFAGRQIVLAPLTAAGSFVLWKQKRGHDAMWLVCLWAGVYLLNELLKAVFRRPRPEPFWGVVPPASFSFPSGHAMVATAVYLGIGYLFTHRTEGRPSGAEVLLGILSFSIGLSRIYLGVHYPSDVLGGFLAAAACLSAAVIVRARGLQRTA